jgi:putative acetyltransferase
MTFKETIRTETNADRDAIARLHRDAFADEPVIPQLVDRLRQLDAPFDTVSLVAVDASGDVIGHVMLSHGWLDAPDRLIDILVLSPLGVTSAAQGKGVGTALLIRAIEVAKTTAAPILFLEGNPAFYGPRGFEPSKPRGIRSPSLRIPAPALQMVRLPSYTEDMTGTLVYRELWWQLDCVGLR